MKGRAVIIALALAGCSEPPQVILPGKLDLAVAKGDELKLCPNDGVQDTTPDADCVLGPEKDALAPYAMALKQKGWTEAKGGELWRSPASGGNGACLTIGSFQTNFTLRERTVLEFHVSACPPEEAV